MVLCVHFTCISWMHLIMNSKALLNQKNQVQQILLVSVKKVYNITYIKCQSKMETVMLL